MDQLRSIVVGIDFTPCCAAALSQAIRIASWNRAKLHAVHVVDTIVAMEWQEALTPFVEEIQEGLVAEARAQWEKFAQDVPGKAGVEFEVAVSSPIMELTRRVRERQADVLVLGSHGISPGRTPGVLATQCVRRAPTRVLLVRDGQRGPYKSVVACVDFSETSRDALSAAVRVAAQDGASLTVLHVYSAPWRKLARPPVKPEVAAAFRDALVAQLRAFCGPDAPGWAKASFEVVEAPGHGSGIVEFVRSRGADLVVLGTRGKTNLRDVLIGSTAERVVRDAPCGILAIKPRA
jgi:nucleotide-binding universal stress UspA family protein